MAKAKTMFKYHLKDGSRVIWRGITDDIERVREYRERQGLKVVQIGRRTTREAALRWEREGGRRSYRGAPERPRTYAVTVVIPEGAGVSESSEYTPDYPFEKPRKVRRCSCQMCKHHQYLKEVAGGKE